MIMAVVFFIPSALLFAELGTAFPEEGGPYVWTRLAFGRLAGAVNNFLYWVTNPVWLGGTLAVTAATAFATFFTTSSELTRSRSTSSRCSSSGSACSPRSCRSGSASGSRRSAPTRASCCSASSRSPSSSTPCRTASTAFGAGDFKPHLRRLRRLVPVLMFQYVGFELPSSAGDEMKDPQKDVPWAIGGSAIAAILLYGIPILGILLVLPTDQVTSLGGFIDAIKSVFTVYGGSIARRTARRR